MKTEFIVQLQALHRHGVECVVVGGVSAILEGAPIHTVDLDIVYRAEAANLARLLAALAELGAEYRDPAGRTIAPNLERLATNRMNLLRTKAGVLDAMREIAPGWLYDDVLARSHPVELSGMTFQVLDLAALIESKQSVDRDKDRAVMPVLRNTLAMIEKRRGAP